ncbi:hypothetical protein [Flavobacterium sp.]|jgi:hypothetical protein|uniref:hypothetical protein n=1 Tax=Flavobacterium sp. TaxID=239 RepID=UPI0040471A0D
MKKIILLLIISLLTSFTSVESDVYICVSKGAKRYHFTKKCKGLSNCKHTIKKVTLSEAKDLGLTLCGWED